MASSIFSKNQIHEVIVENRFKLTGEFLPSNLDELTLIRKTAEEYGFQVDQLLAEKILKGLFENNIQLITLKEKYNGAVIHIRGDFSVKPEYSMNTEEGFVKGELFVYHETLINKLHKELSKKLIEEKAVELFPGCDEEYLYETISETAENYLFEILNKVAKNLPIFQVNFDVDGTFKAKEMGIVS